MRNIKLKLIISLLVMTFGIILLSNTCNAALNENSMLQIGDTKLIENGNVLDTSIVGANYDQSSNTLTLNNYTGSYLIFSELGTDLKVKIIGTNTIQKAISFVRPDLYSSSIVTFVGNGILNVYGEGICGNVTLDGPTINIIPDAIEYTGLEGENLNVISGKLVAQGGIAVDNFSCNANMICKDNNGNKLYFVSAPSEEGPDSYVFCTTSEYSLETICKHIIIEKNIKNVNVTDTTTGTKLTTTTENIPEDVKLVVNNVSNDTVSYVLSDKTDNFKTYDIYLEVGDQKVQPNGKVRISLLIPEGFDTKNLVVYYVDGDDLVEFEVEIEKIDNNYYATFETDHFSTYVLAEKKVATSTNNNIDTSIEEVSSFEKDKTPKTGCINIDFLYLAIAVIALSSSVFIFKKLK